MRGNIHGSTVSVASPGDRQIEADIPWRLEERVVLAHHAGRGRIVGVHGQAGARVVVHAEAVAHLVGGDVAVKRGRQADLVPPIGAAVDPERRPAQSAPIGAEKFALLGPVVRIPGDPAVTSRERTVAPFSSKPVSPRRSGPTFRCPGIDSGNVGLHALEDPAPGDVHRAERDIAPLLHESA